MNISSNKNTLSRKDRDKLRNKEAILDAAVHLFAQKGFAETKLEDVAALAEFGKGTLYNYFENKEDLFLSAFDYAVENVLDFLYNQLSSVSDPLERIRLIANSQFNYYRSNTDFMNVVMTNQQILSNHVCSQPVLDRFQDLKKKNKAALLKECGLPEQYTDKPVIGLVSRLVEQKGVDLIVEALDRILSLDSAVILLGSGEPRYHKALQEIAGRHKSNFFLEFKYNNPLSHRIIAGTDLFLMPSRYEPCGITQMYCLKYGTLPVVRRTGGLADTVEDAYGKSGSNIKPVPDLP